MAERRKKPDNPLKAWAYEAMGAQSQVAVATRAGRKPSWLSRLLNAGSGEGPSMRELALALGRSPVEVFKVLGWLTDDDLETPRVKLSPSEEALIQRLRTAPPDLQPKLAEQFQALAETFSATR